MMTISLLPVPSSPQTALARLVLRGLSITPVPDMSARRLSGGIWSLVPLILQLSCVPDTTLGKHVPDTAVTYLTHRVFLGRVP